jgi:uncharacterized protein
MIHLELIALVLISWALIWFLEKKNLSVLGLALTKQRVKYSTILFIVTAICCASWFLMRMYFGQERFGLNPKANAGFIITGILIVFESVLFEELLCRGVGLYILIKKLGQKWAIVISATIFGLLHWLNDGVFGDWVQMLIIFAYTFTFGLVMAYAFAKSFSIYLPIAIHFGWNLVQNFIFPGNNPENSLFITIYQPVVTVSYLTYFTILLFPKISAIVLDFLIVRSYRRN